jgi:hypothetical protein
MVIKKKIHKRGNKIRRVPRLRNYILRKILDILGMMKVTERRRRSRGRRSRRKSRNFKKQSNLRKRIN